MRAFADTNVLVYAFSDDARSAVAEQLLEQEPVISIQVLNEFVSAAKKKPKFDWPRIIEARDSVLQSCSGHVLLQLDTHKKACTLAARHGVHIYDATIVASALDAGYDVLWTEDMHDGLVVEGRLTIRNPFA